MGYTSVYSQDIAEDLQVDLVGYWPLDENEGTTTADVSKNGNTGDLNGDVAWVEGMFGSALTFDGDGDYVNVGNDDILEMYVYDFSISLWVNIPDSVKENKMAFFAKGGDEGGGIRYFVGTDGGTDVKIIVDDNNSKFDPNSDSSVVSATWHHVVAYREGNLLRLYIDGVEDMGITNNAESTLPDDYNISPTVHDAYIGCITDNNDITGVTLEKFFIGIIDDVAVWSRALTVEEIEYLWNDGEGNPIIIPEEVGISNLNNIIGQFTVNYSPLNSSISIRYSLQENCDIKLKIFNSLGQHITDLYNGTQVSGTHTVQFGCENLSSGIYFARLQTEKGIKTIKFSINK